MKGEVRRIEYKVAKDFVLPRHYSGRMPSVSYAFGWYINDELVAVCTFGKPASHSLCVGVCGFENAPRVFELNRLVRVKTLKHQLSQFVSACLRQLKPENLIIVSYSDTAMKHHGYIYQATNFLYTGVTKRRTDKYVVGNKHSRHYNESEQKGYRKVRSAKHRYVFFATATKTMRKTLMDQLNYKILPYPKGDNGNYKLGTVLKQEIIQTR